MSKTIAIKLIPKAERLIKKGHPWVFSESIKKINDEPETGDICILYDNRFNKFYALGLYDKNSPIRIKILSNKPAVLDEKFFFDKIQSSFLHRKSIINSSNNAYRLIYGENDFLPSIIADVYDKTLVLKLYSSIWLVYIDTLISALIKVMDFEAIVLRLSRSVIKENKTNFSDGDIVYGSLKHEEVIFKENDVKFFANVVKGHKTGFFLDHRQNRIKLGKMSYGKSILDVFAYAGGFSIHALMGGAKKVTSVDISKQALLIAEKNAELNGFKNKLKLVNGDAFEVLREDVKNNIKYDIVVIDPPSFAKSKKEIAIALTKYAELADLGYKLTENGGILILASCSSRVTLEDFKNCHQSVFRNKKISLLEITQHDIDHPSLIEESQYLKTIYPQFRKLKYTNILLCC